MPVGGVLRRGKRGKASFGHAEFAVPVKSRRAVELELKVREQS